ncbi:hypothetical protein Pelo_12659 [Pelomyxa schiedti]|nr:hypothetical protein Pelo_12659 [Pelomyxa schiedti]
MRVSATLAATSRIEKFESGTAVAIVGQRHVVVYESPQYVVRNVCREWQADAIMGCPFAKKDNFSFNSKWIVAYEAFNARLFVWKLTRLKERGENDKRVPDVENVSYVHLDLCRAIALTHSGDPRIPHNDEMSLLYSSTVGKYHYLKVDIGRTLENGIITPVCEKLFVLSPDNTEGAVHFVFSQTGTAFVTFDEGYHNDCAVVNIDTGETWNPHDSKSIQPVDSSSIAVFHHPHTVTVHDLNSDGPPSHNLTSNIGMAFSSGICAHSPSRSEGIKLSDFSSGFAFATIHGSPDTEALAPFLITVAEEDSIHYTTPVIFFTRLNN